MNSKVKKQIHSLIPDKDNFKKLKTLLEENIDEINLKSVERYTSILGKAAHFGNLELVKLLVRKYKVPVNSLKGEFFSPIERAVQFDHYEVAIYLMKKGADLNSLSKNNKIKFALYSGILNESLFIDTLVEIMKHKNPDFFK